MLSTKYLWLAPFWRGFQSTSIFRFRIFLKILYLFPLKVREHEYIFSKYYWNLIKNIILIFRCVAWNYFNNCLRIYVFINVCFSKQKKFLNCNRFSLISLKILSFKSNWFDLKCEISNFDWRQKMRFLIFRKYYRKIILLVTCSKYFRNI